MVNGYVNLPQKIVDAIHNIPKTDDAYTTTIHDAELCDEVHRIFNLGKPVLFSADTPIGARVTAFMVIGATGDSETYDDNAIAFFGTVTITITASSRPTEGPDGDVIYAKSVYISLLIND